MGTLSSASSNLREGGRVNAGFVAPDRRAIRNAPFPILSTASRTAGYPLSAAGSSSLASAPNEAKAASRSGKEIPPGFPTFPARRLRSPTADRLKTPLVHEAAASPAIASPGWLAPNSRATASMSAAGAPVFFSAASGVNVLQPRAPEPPGGRRRGGELLPHHHVGDPQGGVPFRSRRDGEEGVGVGGRHREPRAEMDELPADGRPRRPHPPVGVPEMDRGDPRLQEVAAEGEEVPRAGQVVLRQVAHAVDRLVGRQVRVLPEGVPGHPVGGAEGLHEARGNEVAVSPHRIGEHEERRSAPRPGRSRARS